MLNKWNKLSLSELDQAYFFFELIVYKSSGVQNSKWTDLEFLNTPMNSRSSPIQFKFDFELRFWTKTILKKFQFDWSSTSSRYSNIIRSHR